MTGALLLATLWGATLLRAGQRERQFEAAAPPLGEIIEVNGRSTHVLVKGSGPDLVLIHGASGNLADMAFGGFIDRLAEDYRVIAIDRPGMGYTTPFFGTDAPLAHTHETIHQQARHLQATAAQLGADKPLVLGHSYGGAVALAWAHGMPEKMRGALVLSGVCGYWSTPMGLSYRAVNNSLGSLIAPPVVAAWAPRSLVKNGVDGTFAPEPVPEGYADAMGANLALTRQRIRTNARQVNAVRQEIADLSYHFPDISVPVSFVHGDADIVVPSRTHSEVAAPRVPGATLKLLPGVGHMPHHTAQAEVIAALKALGG